MKAILVICLLTSAVLGLPNDVTNHSENRIGETGVEGPVGVVGSSLEVVLEDHDNEFDARKLNINHKKKKKPKKTSHTAKEVDGKVWVFLVAGSDGWSNYRHQADICHAYQTLALRGIPKENIIVMMKDDIATNSLNPYKGKIINEPNGTDVYEGVIIDYRGDDVTPENFIKVLEGDKKAMEGIGSGRVIESTKKDTIFVNYDDHGSYGYLVFPNRNRLSAQNLSDAIHSMIEKKRFNKMLLYLEACESGSMADSLYSSNSSVLVVTASGRFESSWACFCDDESMPCMGDAFSVGWIKDLYKEFFLSNKTVFDQFDYVRTLTSRSHVNIYGDYRLAGVGLEDFFGKDLRKRSTPVKTSYYPLDDVVDASDASLYWLKKMSKSPISADANGYIKTVAMIEEGRKIIHNIFFKIVVVLTNSKKEVKKVIDERYPINFKSFKCYENLTNIFSDRCVDIYKNAYTLRHLYKLYNLCLLENNNGNIILPKFMKAVESICDDQIRALAEIV